MIKIWRFEFCSIEAEDSVRQDRGLAIVYSFIEACAKEMCFCFLTYML